MADIAEVMTRTRQSIVMKTSRQMGRHRVKILCRELNIDVLPEGLAPDADAILGWLSGRKIVRPHEIEEATGIKTIGLQFAVLDFDAGCVYYVYVYEA